MATYYWVGGNGTWDTTTTTNWALSSGGAGSAGVPTSADNVIFDSNSGAAPTVTISSAVCSACTIGAPTSGTLTFDFGASTLTLAGNFTVNTTSFAVSGTGTISMSATSPTFTGNGLTYYNVAFTSTSGGTCTIRGANSYNDLTFTSISSTGIRTVNIGADQTVAGTLTFGTANTAIRRMGVVTDTTGVQRTITAATVAAIADVDFRDIAAAGASAPWSGTRIGDGLGNNNITCETPKTVYWNLAGGGSWGSTAWTTSSGGAVAANNFPLAQDTCIIEDTGLNSGGTINAQAGWWLGNVDFSTRTLPATWAIANINQVIYGSITLSSAVTPTFTTSTGAYMLGSGTDQEITCAGKTLPALIIGGITSTAVRSTVVKLMDDFTQFDAGTTSLYSGTLNLNDKTFTCRAFASSGSSPRTIAFGTGQIVLTTNNTTIWTTATATNFSYTGTSKIVANYAGSTGTRTIQAGSTTGTDESNALNFEITGGTDGVTFGNASRVRSLDLTGWAGNLSWANFVVYGNLTLTAGTVNTSTSDLTFAATSGTQQVTTNGASLDRPIVVNAPGATVSFQDALTQGSTRAFTLTAGTVEFASSATTTVGSFGTTGAAQKFLQSTTPGAQATVTAASGTFNIQNLTVQDINATGGARWNAVNGSLNYGNNTGWYFAHQQGNFLPMVP